MRKLVAVTLLAAGLPVHAQVYKCEERGETVFSDMACDADAAPVEVKPAAGEYSARDALLAQSRTRSEQAELARIEGERADNRRMAAAERALQRQAEAQRCARIRKDKAAAENRAETSRNPLTSRRAQEKARRLGEREFFECAVAADRAERIR